MSDVAEWFYARGSQQMGPVTLEALRLLAVEGKLTPADLVWKNGTPDWKPAGEERELFEPDDGQPDPNAAAPTAPATAPAPAPIAAAPVAAASVTPAPITATTIASAPIAAAQAAAAPIAAALSAVATATAPVANAPIARAPIAARRRDNACGNLDALWSTGFERPTIDRVPFVCVEAKAWVTATWR